MDEGAIDEAAAGLTAAVDVLLSAPFEGLATASLTRLMCDLEVQRRRLAGVDQRLIAALSLSGAVLDSGSTSLADLVSALTRCSRGEARARVGRSVDLGPRRAVSGEQLEPIHPITAAAVAAGEVSEAQCQVIVSALARIGPDAEPGAFEVAERFLIEAARYEPPAALALSAKWALAQLDPSGLEPVEQTAQRTRNLSVGDAPDGDGVVDMRARLTPETAAALRAVLGALSAPRPADGSGERDQRSLGQRQHDALLEIALRILRSGDLPDSGGVPASVIIQLRAQNVPSNADADRDASEHGEPDAAPTSASGSRSDASSGPIRPGTAESSEEPRRYETGTHETATDGAGGSEPDARGAEDDGAEDDGAEDDGAEDDGAEDDGAEDDGAEDDGAEDDRPATDTDAVRGEPGTSALNALNADVANETNLELELELELDLEALAAAGVDVSDGGGGGGGDGDGGVGPGQVRAWLEPFGHLGADGPVSLNRLGPLLDSCDVTTVILTASGGILDYGRERRTPPPAMRRALAGRDRGCCFPGCDRPPAWTEAHHVLAWIEDNGPTSVDNLCLLCSYHHRMFTAAGWHVTMRDGLPWWTPPAWLDPHRTPIRNTTRHLPAIDFGQIDTVLRT